MERCSHALVDDGRVWVIDPLVGDGVEERIRAAGEPAGVLQLLDRHNRDCAELAKRLGVPHHVVPTTGVPPFELIPIRMGRRWKEVALWWPERRVLVCADALGTATTSAQATSGSGFIRSCGCGRRAGSWEDWSRRRSSAVTAKASSRTPAAALREALSTSRRRIPGQVASACARLAGESTQLAATKPIPIASAPPAASKKKWLPVATMTSSITAG